MRLSKTTDGQFQGPAVRQHIDIAFDALKRAELAAEQDARLHDALHCIHHAQDWVADARTKV